MTNKINIAVICGGQSTEHEVSLASAKNIVEALDPAKFTPQIIKIEKSGAWTRVSDLAALSDSFKLLLHEKFDRPTQSPENLIVNTASRMLNALSEKESEGQIDVVFPVVHGTIGEDGSIQGLLRCLNIPFVGADVLGSSIGMDKDVMKRLLIQAGIPTTKFLTFRSTDQAVAKIDTFSSELGPFPYFVKPANSGSSVGVSKVSNTSDLHNAITHAFEFDSKILIEEGVIGRELECAVLGNESPIASDVAEILIKNGFYSYEAKYLNDTDAELVAPAVLPDRLREQIREMAIRVFQTLECQGMARIDFFLDRNDRILVNEINTIPGFTNISMYPRLWSIAGVSYSELIERLITLAIERHKRLKKLRFDLISK
jgi:D-alanine-D-alanine ligase